MKRTTLERVTVHVHGELPVVVAAQKRALQSMGFSDTKASTNLSDLDGYAANRSFDLVLLNVGPKKNPREALSVIRSQATAANPFALVIGVLPMPNKREFLHLVRMGMDGVISRPFLAEDFWKQLKTLASRQRAFVKTPEYFGPDRRRLQGFDYEGEERRKLLVKPRPEVRRGYEDELTDWLIDS